MYDCIIVGAGPAGGTAAYHLAKQGRSVLVLEKESLPRYKPCGGGVSPAIAKWFDFDFSPVISLKVDTIRFTWKKGDPVETKIQTIEPVWMVQRYAFDHFLVKQAQNVGAELKDGTEVKSIAFKSDHWEVSTANGGFSARYLIAADGANGPMSKWLGFKEPKRRMAAALEAPVAPGQDKSKILFEFGTIKNGYIWSFPKADGVSIGATTFLGGEPGNFTKIFKDCSSMLGIDISAAKEYSHPICVWNGNKQLHTQNAVLAGETAGVVDPMTAEGIRPSIFSGMKAAEAIHKALGGDANALEQYTEVINEEWGADLAWAQKLAGAFYRFPGVGYKAGVKRPTGSQIMGQILCGQLRYGDVVGRALTRLVPFG
ncbi:MAG: geranylgeranyl reductase family protein [Rivularia sp. ALOHA_DT_140]|nr:geranylgeranyl reductase family protein [Rivularia sp. ALOHA_DT_140]